LVVYNEAQNGGIRRSHNGGFNFASYGGTGNGGYWVTPMQLDPNNHNRLLVGKDHLYSIVDDVADTIIIPSELRPDNQVITALNISKKESDIMYIAYQYGEYVNQNTSKQLLLTKSGGATWTDISPDITEVGSLRAQITSIAIHPTNDKRIWITYSGYNETFKVLMSTNGGLSWENFSEGLPSMPMNKIIIDQTLNGTVSCESLYLATDVGVFYRNANMNQWECFSDGIPNVPVLDIEMDPYQKILRCATFGRGIWESPMHFQDRTFGTSDFTYTIDSCRPTIMMSAISLESWPNQQWELFEIAAPDPSNTVCPNPNDYTCDGNTLSGPIGAIQFGGSAAFDNLDPDKYYYIKHTTSDDCHAAQEVRKYIPYTPTVSFQLEDGQENLGPIFCVNDNIYLNAEESEHFNQYTIELTRRMINSSDPFVIVATHGPVTATDIGILNISSLFTFEGGYDYQVVLMLNGTCVPISGLSNIITMVGNTPPLDASYVLNSSGASVTVEGFNLHTDRFATHQWEVFYDASGMGTRPFTHISSGTGSTFGFTPTLEGWYIIFHSVTSVCAEVCYGQVYYHSEESTGDANAYCKYIPELCDEMNCFEIECLFDPQSCGGKDISNLNAPKETKKVVVYPNPSNGTLSIEVSNTDSYEVEIFDFYGNRVLKNKFQNKSNQMELEHLNAGLYFIIVIDKNQLIDVKTWVKI